MIRKLMAAVALLIPFYANSASATFAPDTTTQYTNPERGWYFSLTLTEFCSGFLETVRDGGVSSQPVRIVQMDISPSTSPASVATALACARGTGNAGKVKVLVKLAYCNVQFCNEGVTIAQAEAHLAGLKSTFYAYRDVLFAVKAGVIGAWGEWADSGAGLDTGANKIRVRNALLDMTPPEIPVLFRNPPILQVWYSTPLSSAERFTGSPKSRSGIYNDCFLTGNGDTSTYPGTRNNPVVDVNYTGTEGSQRSFAAQHTDGTAFGGETCDNGDTPLRLNCAVGTTEGITREGPYYHLTFLHRNYADVFYNQWITDGCYTNVTNLMGYRFQLDTLSHADTMTRNSTYTFTLTMRNNGWARLYSARQIQVRMVKAAASDIVCKFTPQLRTLPPVATSSTTLRARCTIPSGATVGSYAVHLEAPDIYTGTGQSGTLTAYKIQFANANSGGQTWDGTNRRFTTGTTVTVD